MESLARPAPNPDTATERLLFDLRERILRGEFQAGERLTELGLVSLLQASRTPIRLALERLAHEGLVHSVSSGGFRVRSFSIADIWDAIEIRGVLEGTAARFAAERLECVSELKLLQSLSEADLTELPVTLEAFASYVELNDRFHQELWRLAKSATLLRSLEAASKLPFAAPGTLLFTNRDAHRKAWDAWVAAEHHRSIVESIRNREGARAEALAREHSRVVRRNLESALQDKDFIRHLPGAALIETD